jgi:helix-turn-helix protein/integrase-like protein
VTVAGFIATQRAQHRVPHATACRALGVSQSWFYKWRDGDPSPRHARRAQLTAAITRLFAAHHGKYGSPRIADDLREAGWTVSEKTVATIMREQRLVARPKKRRKNTTRQGKGKWRAPDLVGRDFPAARLNQKWYGDGTEIATDEGKLYLDSVLDMGSRRVVGFAMDSHHDAELAHAALAMAVAVRGGKQAIAGVIMHTDQGSEGGFNWSSQHLVGGGVVRDDARAAAAGSVVSGADSVSWPADGGLARGSGAFLGGHCTRRPVGGRRGRDRRVASGRDAVVSSRWRRGSETSAHGVGPLLVVRGAGGHRDLARPEGRCP